MEIPRAPIPGANYTSDTRNYPWHRPPDIDNYDEAVAHILKRLETPSGASLVYSMLDIDMPIATITSAIILQAISKGKIQIDMGIVIAGAIARGIEIFALTHDLKYDMGADADDEIIYTPTQLQMILEQQEDQGSGDPIRSQQPMAEEPASEEGGLMGAPATDDIQAAPDEEQQAMLGVMDEEETSDGVA